jgi:spermidine/putrescine-binding protein
MSTWNAPMDRRRMLRRMAAVSALPLGATLLSACGGSASSADLSEASGTVRTLLWDGYADPKAYAPLLDPGKIQLKSAVMNSDEDPITKKGTYDVSVGVDGAYPAFRDIGLDQPLDEDKIPNLDRVLESDVMFKPGTKFAEYTVDDDGKPHGIPFAWGVLAATYNSDKVKAPESLDDLLTAPFAGKFAIGDDGPRVIGVMAKSMGIGGTDSLGRSPAPYLLTEADMDKVMARLDQFKAQAQSIMANPYGEFSSAYGRGEIVAAFPDWPPTAATAQQGGVGVKTAIVPGGISFMDNFFISSDADTSDANYAFLNQAIAESTQYDIMKALAIAPVNRAALDRLVKEGPAWSDYEDVDAVLEAAPTAQTVPAESDTYLTLPEWLSRWEKFKAS